MRNSIFFAFFIMVFVSGVNAQNLPGLKVERLPDNPVIKPSAIFKNDTGNLMGAAVIIVPEWVQNKLGKYYLYCASHHGKEIYLFYADKVTGPYFLHGSVLHIGSTLFDDHICYPTPLIDVDSQYIVMYYHGERNRDPYVHGSGRSISRDGLVWTEDGGSISGQYIRAAWIGEHYYFVGRSGSSWKRKGIVAPLESFGGFSDIDPNRPRHPSAYALGNSLYYFYSAIGDAPERIKLLIMEDVRIPKVQNRIVCGPFEVLKPEMEWEGANLPIAPSITGESKGHKNQIRTPYVFTDDDGKTYLFYSVKGEHGIAVARIVIPSGAATSAAGTGIPAFRKYSRNALRIELASSGNSMRISVSAGSAGKFRLDGTRMESRSDLLARRSYDINKN